MGAARWVSLDRPEKLRVSRPHSPTQGGTLNSASGLTYLQSGRRDSNPRRSAWKADTLPLSYARNSKYRPPKQTESGQSAARSTLVQHSFNIRLRAERRLVNDTLGVPGSAGSAGSTGF